MNSYPVRYVSSARAHELSARRRRAFASTLKDPTLGYVSRYALGRDYLKSCYAAALKTGRADPTVLRFAEFLDRLSTLRLFLNAR